MSLGRQKKRSRRRAFAIDSYRKRCRDAIDVMRAREFPAAVFRAELKRMRHEFAREIRVPSVRA